MPTSGDNTPALLARRHRPGHQALQPCPHLETTRQHYWPEDTGLGTKLWGPASDLQRTADFMGATELSI
ncbi:hypothetical protein V1264_010758 [Littorina saxatilis]|uniref:Uncharacterized protein n=1 Tax=Littorina saxatilis TaxID=31220 RepID=A0AAN9AQ21_9CAEN